jgi:hypothetical protein
MIITEDKIAEWVDSTGGLLITRNTHNANNYPFSKRIGLQYVCLTGYSIIINHFFQNVIQQFNSTVILIIIESDVVSLSTNLLNHPKLQHCFTWNKPFHHPKLSAIPIGLNYNRQHDAMTKWLIEHPLNTICPQNLLCMNYTASTDPSRVKLVNHAKTNWTEFCSILPFIPNVRTYSIPSHIEGKIQIAVTNPECYTQLSNYMFVLSPKGAGEDCHRTWEAVQIGCIPIVLSSNLNELYQELPILIVESWDLITKSFLEESYLEIKSKRDNRLYDMNKITLEYWIKRFQNISNVSQTKHKIHFITYGNSVFEQAKQRLLIEARHFGEFDTITGYGPTDLSTEFQTKYKEILDMKRGGGYWIWKPEIIRQSLNKIDDNDYLVYLDAGCKLNSQGKTRFNEYIDLLNNSPYGILSFQMINQIEKVWTTQEIFQAVDINIDSEHASSGQYLGGVLIMKKNAHLLQYLDEFDKIIATNPLLCTDIYNTNGQCSQFKDNRHDQSISSLLRKKMGSVVIHGDESWIPPFGIGLSLNYPFWGLRSKT